ncbi:hypothetical protein PDK35_02455 [Bacillus cereus group sp. TH153LC]|uniref:hypothetical protein n=1 Tax=Bacillus cereus group sp. TH153LC TaxID=3018059 RepID=UPI0022E4DA79|nr:hypothetical protein [Bacillus cereus group sp. TH153LC]MDA1658837.1 hypothetical protein [Bacillus cereus group sp. TH153LC]
MRKTEKLLPMGNYYQTSIYDFLQEEKSQEVAPSETLPQVDEAQESEKLPSSALDTKVIEANKLISEGENPFKAMQK